MFNDLFHGSLLAASFVTALAVFIALFFISAPYGRYARRGWGPQIPTWLGWLLMESVSALLMLVMFLVGDAPLHDHAGGLFADVGGALHPAGIHLSFWAA